MDGPPASPASGSGLRTSPALRPLRPLILFGTVVLVTASLYWARGVLIPIALATLLTFLLSPLANALERWRLGRALSVIVVVGLAFSLIAGAGWALTQQASTLAADMPKYTATIKDKVAKWRRGGGGRFLGRVQSSVDEVVGEIAKTVPARERPMPVVIQGGQRSLLAQVTAVTEPLAEGGLVALLVVFMLFERGELRNRLIRLVGYGRVTLTTKALDEAAHRISRYLLGQSLVNSGIGLAFTLGLVVIGMPYALLWGALLAILRFIPYVGVWLAVAAPILFSLAVFDEWTTPVSIAAIFLVLELIVSGVVEPVIYSRHAGVSKVALLAAIAVWTWLWGPIGLVLATPMTVCLLVFAKYIPEMEFVTVLVGDEPALEPPVSYYQRLLAEDTDEAREIVEEFVAEHPPERVFDDLLVPALVAAKRDAARDRLSPEGLQFVVTATEAILDDVPRGHVVEPEAAAPAGARILCCPVRDKADEVILAMLRRLLDPGRFDVELTSPEVLASELVALVEARRPALVCLSSLAPGSLAPARYLCKRLRARHPGVRIVVGRWGPRPDDGRENWDDLLSAGADHVSAALLDARDHVAQFASLQPPTAGTPADGAAGAPRGDELATAPDGAIQSRRGMG
jgi:predicted PurR-regulated permease PerM